MKRFALITSLLLIALCSAFSYLYVAGIPPDETKLIANFNAHREVYERLREMLLADKTLRRVAAWGVETEKAIGPQIPPDGLPVERYKEYLQLLKELGAEGATRGDEPSSGSCILVWSAGFAGDTRHLEICWSRSEPSPQVASLKDFYRTPKPRQPVFRKIEGNWYLWADW